jgi:aqualysin 1
MECPPHLLQVIHSIADPFYKSALSRIGDEAILCEPVFMVRTFEIPGLDRIDQRSLPLNNLKFRNPAFAFNGSGTHVFVLDTGIRSNHTEFSSGPGVQSAFSAVLDGFGTEDCNGHGTHVSATIAGKTFGIAREATLHAVRVLDCSGSGSTSAVVQGLDFVVRAVKALKMNGQPVPALGSMSLGGPASAAMDLAVQRVIAAGVTMVVAAGTLHGLSSYRLILRQ